jgi:hypothetical protein
MGFRTAGIAMAVHRCLGLIFLVDKIRWISRDQFDQEVFAGSDFAQYEAKLASPGSSDVKDSSNRHQPMTL